MKDTIKPLLNFNKFNSYINDIKNEISPVSLSGLTDVAKIHMTYATHFYTKKPICILTYNEIQAKRIIKDMAYFTDKIAYIPKKEIVTYEYLAESKENLYNRIDAINMIHENKAEIIVTTIEAVSQKMIFKKDLYKNELLLKVGDNQNLEDLKLKLIQLGYERTENIEGRGQFAVRGGIVDVATLDKRGIRIEFWGDEIDSIRYFEIINGKSTEMLDKINIYPAHENLIIEDIENIINIIQKNGNNKQIAEDIEKIRNGNFGNKIDKYFNSFYEKQDNILAYLPSKSIICLDEISKIKARLSNIQKDNKNIISSLVEKEKVIPDLLKGMIDYDEIIEEVLKKQVIYLERQDVGFIDSKNMHAKRNGYSFSYREVNFFRSSMDLFLEEMEKAKQQSKRVIILGGNEFNCKQISKILTEKDIQNTLKPEEASDNICLIKKGALSAGFESYDFNLLVVSGEELFSAEKKKIRASKEFKEGQQVIFSDLKNGDYVVHRIHGIGQFVGVNTIKADNVIKDYIKIKYKGEDILYIPTNQLGNIRKYIGVGETGPRLNKLGSKEWQNTKAKVKTNLKEVARELIELYAKRQKIKGFGFSKDTPWQKEFEDKFPYIETDDQLRCIEETKKDMEQFRPMDRLLCGDVGYGKTEVAIRAAFKACMDQKQVAYLVPTTILANQQYETFKNRMNEFAIKVELLNRFKTKKEQTDIIRKLKLGEIDVVVGTHRILSSDVEFKDLGLLIIDEEHRFGVKDKEKIKTLKNNVDVLTMTATPIPRTLHMSIVGIRDMSVIYDPPQNRKPVQTYVLEYDEEVIQEAIIRELERDGQVFYLYNKVETIETKANKIAELVPEAKVMYAHGKMSGTELEEIMQDFIDKKINVLVCTTILESGIDIPNANTIIVENGERLGLAQLYQIRGRVGRSNTKAYAYITYKRDKLLAEASEKRLKAIKEFTEFGSGFKIAMRDLEIRGAGSLLGEIQHGHMEQVGYDMYCKLLDEVVKEMQGIEEVPEQDIQIDLSISSYIPDEFISNSSQKIEIYQNISLCKTEEDIQIVIDDIIDRYGRIPDEIENLVQVIRIKNLCEKAYVQKIVQKDNNIVFYFDVKKLQMDLIDKLVKIYKNQIKFSATQEPYVTYTIKGKTEKEIIKQIKEFLKSLLEKE